MSMTIAAQDIAERHVLSFADCDVEVVIHTGGEVDINVVADETPVASFDPTAWKDVVKFVAAAMEMTS